MDLSALAEAMGIEIDDQALYRQALVHVSYSNEHPEGGLASNERLEFLGDAVLQLVVSEYLYNEYPSLSEGELTRARAAVVCTETLSRKGRELGLGGLLLLGRGEESSGGRDRPSLLENAFEALVGAAFLDGGLERARRLVVGALAGDIAAAAGGGARRDCKTELQEWTQRIRPGLVPDYRLVGESGPDHAKVFEVVVEAAGRELGRGVGRSKKSAEQEAARRALEVLRNSGRSDQP